MNYYDARELTDHSGWRYTCMNDGRIWAVGYCAEHDPHPTKDSAHECFTGYLLDTKLRLDGRCTDAQHRCEESGCERWTDRFAEVDGTLYTLCDDHRTRDVVTALFGTVGSSASSW